MTIQMDGLSAVQARMAAIQSQLAAMSPSATKTSAATTAFETALSSTASSTGSTTGTTSTTTGTATGTTTGTTTSTSGTPTTSTTSGTNADALITAAKKYLGVPYLWGGTNPDKGLDCSGFVQRAYKDIGVSLPRVSRDQAKCGTKVDSLADAKPGDLVAFGSPVNHIGIYVGNNKMIVAPKTGDVVKIQTVYRTPTAIRRILPDVASTSTTTSIGGTTTTTTKAVAGSALAEAPAAYRAMFEAAGAKYGISPSLLAAVAKRESDFDPTCVSSAGARGLMQFMPATAKEIGINPDVPAQAVDGAAKLLSSYKKKYGSTELALAAYNAGPGAVQRYGGVPPYAETRTYIRLIMADSGVKAS